jgi:hypothetical protein
MVRWFRLLLALIGIACVRAQSVACLRVTHAFDDTSAPPAIDASSRQLTSRSLKAASECRNATQSQLTLAFNSTDESNGAAAACALRFNATDGGVAVRDCGATVVVVTLVGKLESAMYILGLSFDAKSFKSGGQLQTGTESLPISRLDDDGSWNALGTATPTPHTAFQLTIPVGVVLRSVVLRIPSSDDVLATAAPGANSTFAPQSWLEANSGLAIGLGSLGLFVLATVALFAGIYVWNKRRKSNAERDELALYGVSGKVRETNTVDARRRGSVTDVVMVDAADDRVYRTKSAHSLLAKSFENQEAPSIR